MTKGEEILKRIIENDPRMKDLKPIKKAAIDGSLYYYNFVWEIDKNKKE